MYDDWHNLSGLATVDDSFSAAQFVFSGHAGPLGRPLSLPSFVPQAEHWNADPTPFIRINILVHLTNVALAFLLFSQLAHRLLDDRDDRFVAAIVSAALWAFMPILASATLLIIQRMATLAAMFCLIGLVTYLFCRRSIESHPGRSLTGMTLSLFGCTSLALLCKENGALLPTLVLVLESTLLSAPRSVPPHRWIGWKTITLGAPTLAIILMLGLQLPYDDHTVLQRGFNGVERLTSELVILGEYLVRALLPQPWTLGPFHDDHEVYQSLANPKVIFSGMFWFAALALAIFYRRRFQVAAFGLLWFVSAHLIESSSAPLNLYFEHRNYLPLVGPAFALSYYLVGIKHKYRSAARLGVTAYIATSAAILFSITSMWGKPGIATGYWYSNAPASAAAASEFAQRQMDEFSPQVGIQTLKDFAIAYPGHAYLRLPELTLSCRMHPDRSKEQLVEWLRAHIPDMSYTSSIGSMFDELQSQVLDGKCRDVDIRTYLELVEAAFSNARYQGDTDQSYYHQLLAKVAFRSGDIDTTLRELRLAISIAGNRQVVLMLVTTLVGQNEFEEAAKVIANARQHLALSPTARIADALMLHDLERYLHAAQSLDAYSGAPN